MIAASTTKYEIDHDHAHAFQALTAMSVALLAMALLWGLVDTRLVGGVPVWIKPAKFALSFSVHFATLALITGALAPQRQGLRMFRLTVAAMTAAFLGEMAYMIVQAAQAETSHFNLSTPFNAVMYQLMGLGAVTLVAGPVVIGWIAYRSDMPGAGLRLGVWLGALTSFVLTLLVAGYMSSGQGHLVGAVGDTHTTLPVFGWSGEVGDLRPAHFLSLHAFQALPLAGLWLDRTGRAPRVMWWLAAGWSALTLAVFAQAVMGLPLVRL
ncbi:MAG: hypothetical protein ACWA47_03435 [Brevirhabdus sp.]